MIVLNVVLLLFIVLIDVGSFRTSFFSSRKSIVSLGMVLSGISDKMGGIMQLIAGQTKITETNIEDTLKVKFLLIAQIDEYFFCIIIIYF